MKNFISKDASQGYIVLFSSLIFLFSNAVLLAWQMFIGRFSAYYIVIPISVPFLFIYYYFVSSVLKWALDKVKHNSKVISFFGLLVMALIAGMILSTASGVIRFPELPLPRIEGFEHRQGIIPDPYWPGLIVCFLVGFLVTFVIFRTKGSGKSKTVS